MESDNLQTSRLLAWPPGNTSSRDQIGCQSSLPAEVARLASLIAVPSQTVRLREQSQFVRGNLSQSEEGILMQTSCDLTDPFAVLRSHRPQSDRASRGTFAAKKKCLQPIAKHLFV